MCLREWDSLMPTTSYTRLAMLMLATTTLLAPGGSNSGLLVQAGKVRDQCDTCREIIKNFQKGLDKTKNQNFGGGDTAWEEEKLGTFAKSETRLLEIMESVCEGADQKAGCHSMIERYEDDIENWWFKKFGPSSELETYLCINKIKVCCHEGNYGKQCKECVGGKSNPCNGHGSCKGSGYRFGNGSCTCDEGYQGGACDECDEGYTQEADKSCQDINECSTGDAGCSDDEYCENTAGSFECHQCPSQCNTCTGPTLKECTDCKEGYQLNPTEGGCEDVDECAESHDICSEEHVCANTNGSYSCVKQGPSGYKYGSDGHFYLFHDAEVTWTEAKDACTAEGSWLAAIQSVSTVNYTKQEYGASRMWIGASDQETEGQWKWVQSTGDNNVATPNVATPNWDKDEPNGKETSNCAVTNWNDPGLWNDEDCDAKYPYLCQFAHPEDESASQSDAPEEHAEHDASSEHAEHDASEL